MYYPYKNILISGSIFLVLLLCLNELLTRFHVYFAFKWFDTPMHILGGFGVGILSIGILRSLFPKEKYDKTPQLLLTLLLVIGVGIAWELVESYYKVSVMFGGNFWPDTFKDLLMDTIGGILSYICFRPRTKTQIN